MNDAPTSKGSSAGLVALPRSAKQFLAILTDSLLCVMTVWLAICFRFEAWVSLTGYQWLAVMLSVLLAIPLLSVFGFYHTVIRFAGKQTVMAAVRAIAVYTLIYSVIFTAYGFPLVPRTIGVLQPLLLLIALAMVRIVASHLLSEHLATAKELAALPAVLIYGAGNSGQQLAASIRASGQSHVVGFLDDNANLHKAQIDGVRIHDPKNLSSIIQTHNVKDVLLAMPRLSRSRRSDILRALSESSISIRTLPNLSDLAQGKLNEAALRELQIEDLLGRDPVEPIPELLSKTIRGKVVLVTGAGGSIGSELCRQIAQLSPKHLIMLDVSEYALYNISSEIEQLVANLHAKCPPLLSSILANVLDQEGLADHFSQLRPQTVFHAAAYKHVPLVQVNPIIGIRNNALGTYHCATAAIANHANDFILISTDKAVRPTSIMGASKRFSEMILQALSDTQIHNASRTRFGIVRFGNVLGSSGSVVPKFREQIKAGGPITVTHPDITRYFMTIPEAASLVIQAAGMLENTDTRAPVYLLDMGEPVKIVDLAKKMIQLSNSRQIRPGQDIQIAFTGLRPGEKLYEELLIGADPQATAHSKIFRANESYLPWLKMKPLLDQVNHIGDMNVVEINQWLMSSIQTYESSDPI